MTPLQHADKASELLQAIEEMERRLTDRHKDPMYQLQDSMNGVTKRINDNNDYSVKLAIAHALAAIAHGFAELPGLDVDQVRGEGGDS